MEWNRRKIKEQTKKSVFHRGLKPYLYLVIVGFIFSFIGTSNQSQTTFIPLLDKVLKLNIDFGKHNLKLLNDYLLNDSILRKLPFLNWKAVIVIFDIISAKFTWLINLLAANGAYFKRNPGEVIGYLFIAAAISAVIRFFFFFVFIVGQDRYTLEYRYVKRPEIRRIFAPFHAKNLKSIILVMLKYNITLFLWNLTIVGGIYKYYQYRMVPYIVAENPNIKWADAKRISMQMTNGYKWKIFCTHISCLYIWALKLIPIAGIMVAVPYENVLNSEIYIELRRKVQSEFFVEDTFDGKSYMEQSISDGQEKQEDICFKLRDLSFSEIYINESKALTQYHFDTYVMFFFSFSFVGWLWEVSLHLMQKHEFVNRGVFAGPWLPIYGVGGVLIIFLLGRFRYDWKKVFVLAVVLAAVLEYATSFILDFFFNAHYWNYHNKIMNLNGRICFEGLLAFGMAGLFGIYVAGPAISDRFQRLDKKKRVIICTILMLLFAADIIYGMIFGFNTGKGVGGKY